MSNFPEFDEVHVISDIHMGGKPGFQILRETQRLANFIDWVSRQRPDGRIALVLNGDVFDTLAEDIHGYVAVDEAVATVQRIMDDPSFSTIWKSLADFVKLEGRALVIVIGNHDIEISFPTVQRLMVLRLAGNDLKARARIEFSTTGAGFTCFVGNSCVYCTHGNEVDAWNYNRYEDLAKVGRRLNAGRSLEPSEWFPNAGTRMVKEVMNDVKRKFAWIDLLKPETSAAIGALLVLDPSQVKKIGHLLSIVGEKVQGQKQADQRLSAEGFQPPEQNVAVPFNVERLLGTNLKDGVLGVDVTGGRSADDMLLNAEEHFNSKEAFAAEADSTLGTPQLIWDRLTGWITGVGKDEALRRAMLDWLAKDKTFDINDQDDTFKQVTAAVGPSIDFIITGHTHLERAVQIGAGRYYFNCGTWIRLLQFTQDMLKDTASFKPIYDVLINGKMETIDNAEFKGKPFVMDQTSAVSIKEEGGKVVGRLTHVVGDGSGEPFEIKKFPE
ncbi:metallophosphoesterase [Methylomicrobium sp. Wu6]|uniref:metallophosphoesterase n=1 Tax=Methylomicrobium sp. Wu6 TaxID=3107928 RepID=UPI002DD632A9|nr:metallophosphoesterase [Methylomicrobium sp. Wu6]MEC4748878.1 metallophosphoesterase [Methylomicrobium sp. Wu6]